MDFTKYNKIFHGGNLNREEVEYIANHASTKELTNFADRVRAYYHKDRIKLCAAMNLKSGKCSEDCKYCSQSGFYNTCVSVYPMQDVENVIAYAAENERHGVSNFELSTSGGKLDYLDKEKLLSIYSELSRKTSMCLCGAHGLLKSVDEAMELKQAGLTVYQHNLQTSRNYFNNVITTHSYDDRLNTLKYAKKAGLLLCSGGIMGLGESIDDRIDMAFDLREIGIASMPINILNPIKGTPFGNNGTMITKDEVFRTIALYRIIMPKIKIIYGAGRVYLGEEQITAYYSGLNGSVVGKFLTTPNAGIDEDIDIIHKAGYLVDRIDN